jgi:hypothetical protein
VATDIKLHDSHILLSMTTDNIISDNHTKEQMTLVAAEAGHAGGIPVRVCSCWQIVCRTKSCERGGEGG